MKRQIFRSICAAAGAVFLAALVLILGVAYDYFSSVQMDGLKTETYIAARAAESGGADFLRSIAGGDYRVTWIAADGEVLFDNRADSAQMENHLEREEIRKALENGEGESTRYSSTLAEQQLYCARRLADGTVLRLSFVHLSRWALMLALLQPIAVVLALALGLFLAQRLNREAGALAVIYVNGERTAAYPLANDTTVTLLAPVTSASPFSMTRTL